MQSAYKVTGNVKRALVLSGGSVKGAYQAGVLSQVLAQGFAPDVIYGVSVGALNGLFLSHRSAYLSWAKIGEELVEFWKRNVTKADDLATKRRIYPDLAHDIAYDQFKGFLNTSPLRSLLTREFDPATLRQAKIVFKVGVVDFYSGLYDSIPLLPATNGQLNPNLIKCVMASASIPLLMPLENIEGRPFLDGGLREVTPLRVAIEEGAEQIVVVMCQPERYRSVAINSGNVLKQTERVLDIMNRETILEDVDTLIKINDYIEECNRNGEAIPQFGFMKNKRQIDLLLVRPSQDLDIDIREFGKDDIARTIELGVKDGNSEIASRNTPFV